MPLRDQFRTALVTGATSGLGAAFAEMLIAEGVEVWGTSRRADRVPPRAGFHGLALELGSDASVRAAWTAARQAAGGIDLLVNNAGEGAFAPYHAISDELLRHQVEVLLGGPALLARLALDAMRTRGCGCIVNVTSLAAEFPIPCMAAYSAAKAGLAGLTAAMVLECGSGPVRVVDFRPGDYRTRFNDAMRPTAGATPEVEHVWSRLEHLLRGAPEPARAARDLRTALQRRRRGVVRSGTFFHARVGRFLQRFA